MFSHFTAWRYRCALIAAICATVAADLLGQVNHVINLPDDPVPDSVHFYTQFNIYEGGALPDLYNLGVGLFPALYVDVNVLGGTVGRRLSLTKGSRLDLFSGRVGTNLGAGDGNVVTIRGGGLGNEFSARAGSEVLVYGSDFRFNGQPVAGLHDVGDRVSVNGMSDGVLTGYLADGTPFAFSGYRDFIADGVLTVELTESTHAEPTLIQVPAEAAPDSVRDGQVLIVDRQAQLPDLFQVGPGSVVIARNDAMLGHELTAVAASVLIDDSRLGALATFLDKSVLRATNSSIDRGLVVADRSTATIDRSPIDGYLWVTDQGVVSLNDSSVNGDLRVQRSSTLDATASNVAGRVTVSEGSTVRFSGAQIQLGLDVLSDSVVYLGGDVVIDQRFGQNSVSGNSDLVLNGATLHGDTVIRDGRFRLHGGTLDTLVAASDGEVSIDGGVVRGLYSSDSATLTISGGSVTESIPYREPIPTGRGLLRLTGSEFRFNGQTIDPVNATSGYERFSIAPGDFVSGVFVDGTPFGFRSMSGVLGGFVELASVEVPESPPILHAANDQLGYGIRDGQTLFVDSGGRIPDDFKAGFGSTVHIGPGGVLGENFHAFGSEVHIHGGDLSNSVFAEYESRIFVHDGAVGATIFAGRDSSVIVDGGRITYLDLEAGSHAEILGGQVDEFHTTYDSSMVVAGGAHDFSTVRRIRGGDITLRGSEFRINGQLSDVLNVVGSPTELDVADDAVVTGLLADGTPFLYTGDDIYRPTRLLLEAVELLPVDMPVIVASVDPVPTGLRDGQRLIVDQGSHIPGRFHAGWGSTVRVEKGGVMNGNMLALGSELELDGGQIATLELRDGSSLTVIDGDAQVSLVDETSHLAIYGGTLRPPRGSAGLSLRGTAEVVGGIVPARMRVNSGGMASIRGGRIVGALTAFGDARVSMEGYAWHINGVPVEAPDEIGANIPISVTPGAVLTGILSDGTPLLLRNAFVADGSLTLVNTAPVARPSMIVASADPIPLGIHD
ncbi:MAG: hypothetical protein KDA99_13925, partial [Planctomycetales bacterium]|nr:hypothetical protein [Planctomycetales bacterium]